MTGTHFLEGGVRVGVPKCEGGIAAQERKIALGSQFIPEFLQTNRRLVVPFSPENGDHFSINAYRCASYRRFDNLTDYL